MKHQMPNSFMYISMVSYSCRSAPFTFCDCKNQRCLNWLTGVLG